MNKNLWYFIAGGILLFLAGIFFEKYVVCHHPREFYAPAYERGMGNCGCNNACGCNAPCQFGGARHQMRNDMPRPEMMQLKCLEKHSNMEGKHKMAKEFHKRQKINEGMPHMEKGRPMPPMPEDGKTMPSHK